MQFGVSVPGTFLYPHATQRWHHNLTPADMLRIAQRADELGYDHLSIPEHIVMHEEWAEVMGVRWPHAVTALAFFAGATKRIRLTWTILIVPYHNPVELAKMLSTLDWLSGGRLIASVGLGYMEWEFNLLKAPFQERGAYMDECLEIMIELWTKEKPEYKGRWHQVDRIAFDPKPAQKPYPPLWIGGYTKPSLRRTAKYGNGWYPWSVARAQIPEMLDYMRAQPEWRQRKLKSFDLVMPLFEGKTDQKTHKEIEHPRIVMEKDAILEQVAALKKLGATATGTPTGPTRNLEEHLERLQWFAEEIIPAAKRM